MSYPPSDGLPEGHMDRDDSVPMWAPRPPPPPLPPPRNNPAPRPPDPRDATIARLTAELVEARERERVLRGVIRGIQRIQSDTEQCRRTRGISHVELVGALDEIGVCCSRALEPKP